jgi:acyl-CoA thioester hydrolase
VLPIRVYYEDTDAAGVVYYANYFKYCERARTEWLRALGFRNSTLLDAHGLVFVVRAVKGDFRAPARLDDELAVVTTLDKLGGASLIFGQRVLRGEELLFDAEIAIACIDLARQRATAIPPAVRAQLQELV